MIAIMSTEAFYARLEQACLPERARDVELRAGETLFRQGDGSPGLALLLDGRVDLNRWSESGRIIRIHVAHPVETFAEASLYADQCHCDAVAARPSLVRLLPKRRVLRVFEGDPSLGQAFTQHLAQSLMHARRRLELRAMTPLSERVLARLSDLCGRDGRMPEGTSLMSIAADLDVSPPALYRSLAALEKRGALTRPARGQVKLKVHAAGAMRKGAG